MMVLYRSPDNPSKEVQGEQSFTWLLYSYFKLQFFLKNAGFYVFPIDNLRDNICFQICQGEPTVSLWTNLVVLSDLILDAEFHGNWTTSNGKKYFFQFKPYMAQGSYWVLWPESFQWNFSCSHFLEFNRNWPICFLIRQAGTICADSDQMLQNVVSH